MSGTQNGTKIQSIYLVVVAMEQKRIIVHITPVSLEHILPTAPPKCQISFFDGKCRQDKLIEFEF